MNQTSVFSNLSQKDKIDYYISLAVVALAGVFIMYYITPDTPANQSANILLENSLDINELEVDQNVYIPVTEDVLKREKIRSVQKIKSVALPNRIDQKQRAKDQVHITRSLDSKTNAIPDLKKNEETTKPAENIEPAKIQETVALQETPAGNTEPKTVDETPSPSQEMGTVEKTIAPEATSETTDCVIVIGAYGKQKSIDKLTKKLLNEDYKIFRTPYKGLTRIGVYLPCDKRTIEQELVKLRKKYAADAMLLRKEN